MHRIIILSILCAVHKNVLAGEIEGLTAEQKQMLDNLHKSCVEETGVAEDLIPKASSGNFAEDGKLKCYMKCLMSTIGVMEDDGTFDFETYIDLLPESMQETGKKVEAKCKHLAKPEGDACEQAFKINKCSYEADPAKYVLF